MKREETINKYLDKYLDGKSEEQREAFLAKDVNKQYSAIMAWKRRGELKKSGEGVSVSEVLKHIKGIHSLLSLVPSMSPLQVNMLTEELDRVKTAVENFEADRARREIDELEQRKRELDEKIAQLREIARGGGKIEGTLFT
ncbi:MAG: hypothetical protein K2M03_01525 [Muribaculaceae bacterium]|nr:hypothetical protein [Muribaculaceae bacterium]